jgi:ribosomal protein S18 acetylase RimI-like enzyme
VAEVRPLRLDDEFVAFFRPLAPGDAAAVAALHHAAMGESVWARLGPSFLEALYSVLPSQPGVLAWVYDDGRVRGFILGTEDSEGLLAGTLLRNATRLGRPLTRGLVARPGLAATLAGTPLYARRSRVPGVRAESLFCSFEPELRGRRLAGQANKVLFDELAARGHRYVKITTDATNWSATRQLRSWGFVERGVFRFYGKPMVRWVLDLSASPRVEAIRFADRRSR